MNAQQLLVQLVDNAFDFLSRSIDELGDQPKYSVIHFHAAIELFLKARLLSEHWSLVVSKNHEPDWDRLVSGDFRSVTLDEAASRLAKVVRSGLSPQELKAFSDVTKHRNRMLHFFHELDDIEKNRNLVRGIAKQQLNAWYYLHSLLTKRWGNVFGAWIERVDIIDGKLRRYHEFLEVVFGHVKKDIAEKKGSGKMFLQCPSCGFESQEHSPLLEELYQSKCLVCNHEEINIRINCIDCDTVVCFANEGFGECESCGKQYEPGDVAEHLLDEGEAYMAAKEGDNSWDLGNCGECDGFHTVVRLDGDYYLCASCFGEFEEVSQCGWCNELNTSDMEHSFLTGCNHCDGRLGWG